MSRVEVFDPAMCCSTGVCGPSVDPALAVFATDVRWLGERGAEVTRYNLAQQPGPFAEHAAVRALLAERGMRRCRWWWWMARCARRAVTRPVRSWRPGRCLAARQRCWMPAAPGTPCCGEGEPEGEASLAVTTIGDGGCCG